MRKVLSIVFIILLGAALTVVLLRTIDLKKQIIALTQEKSNLADVLSQREMDLARLNLKQQKLEEDFKEGQKNMEGMTSKNSALQAENSVLKEEIDKVKLERDSLQAKLLSIPELKKLIIELKQKTAQVNKIVRKRFKVENIKKIERIIIGNRGYLIKDGQPTYNTAVKIDVEPAIAP